MITGKRIYLKNISKSDTDLIIRWRNQTFVRKNFIYQGPFTKEIHENWLETQVDTGRVKQFIIYVKSLDWPIGSVYIRDIDYVNQKAEYGIFIGEEEFLGKGYGAEAGILMVEYAFKELHLHKIMLKVFSYNTRARKNYQKAGFIEEGILKDEVYRNGNYYDIIYMAKIYTET